MSDPHEQGRMSRDHYYQKTEIKGRIIAIMDWAADDRDMTLMPQLSRAVRRGDVLELITTDEEDRGPGTTVNRMACLGFLEILEAGLIVGGDTLSIEKEDIGQIIGFNETHMPNHMNVVIHVKTRQTGRAAALKLDALVKIIAIDEEEEKRIGF